MARSKKRLITLVAVSGLILSGLMLSGLIISTPVVHSEAPDPQCVCAGCGYACGSGHASDCPYKPK